MKLIIGKKYYIPWAGNYEKSICVARSTSNNLEAGLFKGHCGTTISKKLAIQCEPVVSVKSWWQFWK